MKEMSQALSLQDVLFIRDNCPCFNFKKTARTLARVFDEAFRSLNITNGQFSLMAYCSVGPGRTISETADFLGMDRTTLTANLKPLERDKLIRISKDPQDKRKSNLALTKKGRKHLRLAFEVWKDCTQQINQEMGTDKVAALIASVQKIGGTDTLMGRTEP